MENVNICIPEAAIEHQFPDGTFVYVWPTSDNMGFHAVRADFVDMQSSPCGVAGTIEAAMKSLADDEAARSSENTNQNDAPPTDAEPTRDETAENTVSEGDNATGGGSDSPGASSEVESSDDQLADQAAAQDAEVGDVPTWDSTNCDAKCGECATECMQYQKVEAADRVANTK